jgi:hypothetical protein
MFAFCSETIHFCLTKSGQNVRKTGAEVSIGSTNKDFDLIFSLSI